MTVARLLMMAQPPPGVRQALLAALRRQGLEARLGRRMFPARNWHQTLSDRYVDSPSNRAGLLCAGARLSARAFTLTFNCVRDQAGGGLIHWAFRAKREPGFAALLAAVQDVLAGEGFGTSGSGHAPHLTLSYDAPDRLGSTAIEPVAWRIDELLLVVGGASSPYHYDVLGRWPLLPPVPDPQLGLF